MLGLHRPARCLLAAALAAVVAGCGSEAGARRTTGPPLLRLAGWRAVSDPPGIAELAPSLSGLRVVAETDRRALVRRGDAIRAATFAFASARAAAAALARARTGGYRKLLVHELHAPIRRVAAPGGAVGYRLDVGRPAEPGRDAVELYLLRRGRTLVLVELLSARGFAPRLRDAVLARISR